MTGYVLYFMDISSRGSTGRGWWFSFVYHQLNGTVHSIFCYQTYSSDISLISGALILYSQMCAIIFRTVVTAVG